MIKERFISKFNLLLDVRNLTFGARHINLINLAQKIKAILYVFRSLDGKFIKYVSYKFSFCHKGTL